MTQNSYIISDGRVVSFPAPSSLRALIRRIHSDKATDDDAAIFRWIIHVAAPLYGIVKFRQNMAITGYLSNWVDISREEAAETGNISLRQIDRWIDEFLRWTHVFAARQADHDRQFALLDSYCDQTHRQSGGHGGTPPIGRREFSAGNCPACAEKRE